MFSSTVIAVYHPMVTISREMLVYIKLCWFLLESYISGIHNYRLFLSALEYLYVVFLVVDSFRLWNMHQLCGYENCVSSYFLRHVPLELSAPATRSIYNGQLVYLIWLNHEGYFKIELTKVTGNNIMYNHINKQVFFHRYHILLVTRGQPFQNCTVLQMTNLSFEFKSLSSRFPFISVILNHHEKNIF